MKHMYKGIMLIIFISAIISFFIKDIVNKGSFSMGSLLTIGLLLILLLFIYLNDRKHKLICILGMVIWIILIYGSSIISKKYFGTDQTISGIQGYISVVFQGNNYYAIPFESMNRAERLYGTNKKCFITKPIENSKMLKLILKDYYNISSLEDFEVIDVSSTDKKRKYKVIEANRNVLVEVYLMGEYSYFKIYLK